jgi:cytochrome b561
VTTVQAAVRYNNVAITLHWIVGVLVLVLVGLGWYMVDIPRGTEERSYFYNLHKSIGLTTGIIVLIRLWWRAKHPPPPLPASMAGWQVTASKISHALLYMCLIMMPIAGFTASQFTKWGVTYFGLFKIPPMAHRLRADGHSDRAYSCCALSSAVRKGRGIPKDAARALVSHPCGIAAARIWLSLGSLPAHPSLL